MNMKKIALTTVVSLLVLIGAVTVLPLRAIAGLETPCNYISDLVATNPLSSDLASTGDDHLRCIKSVLKTTFPNINAAVTATDENLNALSASSTAAGILELEAAAPRLIIDETDATTNERIYDFASSAGLLLGRTRTDADGAGASWLSVDRNGTTVTSIALASTALTWNSNTLFTTANDGSGSGLDADLLDGSSSAAFATLAGTNAFTTSYTSGNPLPISLSSAVPLLEWSETDAAANNQSWYIGASGEQFGVGFAGNDARTSLGSPAILIDRTANTIDTINLQATAVQINGNGVVRSLSGTYTPTASATSNLDSTSPAQFQYTRVGNVVTVSGVVVLDATAAASTFFELSLPIASNLTSTSNLAGGGGLNSTTGSPGLFIRGVVANDTAQVLYVSPITTSTEASVTFTYIVQ